MSGSDRGRKATGPSEIPPAGWKDILWRVYAEISDDRVMLVAAGVTYYLLLAMVPALSAFVSVFGLFADPSTIQQQVTNLSAVVPGGGMQIIGDQLERLAQQDSATLGFTFVISLLVALWSANAGMKSLFEAMNVAYDEPETRGFFKLTLISLAFTIAAVGAAVLFLGVVLVVPVILNAIGLGQGVEWLIRIGSYVGMAILVSLGIAALYRWGPSRESAQWKWISPGVLLTMVLVVITSVLFSWYAANFGSYNATYGSLGALIGFMTWIWLSTTILIVGGELNSEMEHQTARDSTTGEPRPMGMRGAKFADHVAGSGGSRRASDEADLASEAAPNRTRRDHPNARKRVSWGTLAFALPATLILAAMQRRDNHR